VFAGIPKTIIADNCNDETVELVKSKDVPYEVTNLGNAGSLLHTLKKALELPENELVYFVEDDYLHLPISPKLLEEGARRAEYLTLYDHPDKYTRCYNGGEESKVIKTESRHWRFTISTCMTFATKVGILREDFEVWQKYTSESHPHDHLIFMDLKEKKRRLAVPIPGAACHTDLEFSGRMNQILIEPWAVDYMLEKLEVKIPDSPLKESVLKGRTGWFRLVSLDALLSNPQV
jgi:hypothetical protein